MAWAGDGWDTESSAGPERRFCKRNKGGERKKEQKDLGRMNHSCAQIRFQQRQPGLGRGESLQPWVPHTEVIVASPWHCPYAPEGCLHHPPAAGPDVGTFLLGRREAATSQCHVLGQEGVKSTPNPLCVFSGVDFIPPSCGSPPQGWVVGRTCCFSSLGALGWLWCPQWPLPFAPSPWSP